MGPAENFSCRKSFGTQVLRYPLRCGQWLPIPDVVLDRIVRTIKNET